MQDAQGIYAFKLFKIEFEPPYLQCLYSDNQNQCGFSLERVKHGCNLQAYHLVMWMTAIPEIRFQKIKKRKRKRKKVDSVFWRILFFNPCA